MHPVRYFSGVRPSEGPSSWIERREREEQKVSGKVGNKVSSTMIVTFCRESTFSRCLSASVYLSALVGDCVCLCLCVLFLYSTVLTCAGSVNRQARLSSTTPTAMARSLISQRLEPVRLIPTTISASLIQVSSGHALL